MRAGWGLGMILLLVGTFAQAQSTTPPPFPDFEAKRVKPPSKTSTNRIRVQITPPVAPPTAAPQIEPITPEGHAPAPARYEWFWEAHSPKLTDANAGRIFEALAALKKGEVATPRLQALQEIAQAHGREILINTVGTDVSPALVLAVIYVESGGNPAAQSRAGAQGLMQLMPATAERFGAANPMHPNDNIMGGVKFLHHLMQNFDQDPAMVLAGYNAGENAVRQHGGVPPYRETRDYVPKVLAAFEVARGLCKTPPVMLSDGCVFAVMK